MSRATASSKGQSPKAQMDLRVFSGIHAGAEVRLPERGILMIGQADDCDLIISDPGIADHHCVLTVVGDQVLLRTLEGRVDIEGEHGRSRGENVTLDHFNMVHLGDHVSLAVGPHWSEHWQKLVDAVGGGGVGDGSNTGNRRVLLVAGLLLAVAVLVLVGGWSLMGEQPTAVHRVEKRLAQTRQILDTMKLGPHVKVSNQADGTLVLRGVVGTPEQYQTLKDRLSDAGLTPQMYVRDWPSVQQAVETIFNMHRYQVQTELVPGRSEILISGHFGGQDMARVKQEVLSSDDMQRLNEESLGLRVKVVDFDAKDEPPPAPDPAKAIKHVKVDKEGMPYLITQDQSRYYPGSQLPQLGKFIGVYPEDGTILIETDDHKVMQLTRSTKYTQLEPEDTHAGHLMPASAASASGVIQRVPLDHAFGADATTAVKAPGDEKVKEESSHVH